MHIIETAKTDKYNLEIQNTHQYLTTKPNQINVRTAFDGAVFSNHNSSWLQRTCNTYGTHHSVRTCAVSVSRATFAAAKSKAW